MGEQWGYHVGGSWDVFLADGAFVGTTIKDYGSERNCIPYSYEYYSAVVWHNNIRFTTLGIC
jgi:hypothetical protein